MIFHFSRKNTSAKVAILPSLQYYDMYDIINYGTMICMILLIMVL